MAWADPFNQKLNRFKWYWNFFTHIISLIFCRLYKQIKKRIKYSNLWLYKITTFYLKIECNWNWLKLVEWSYHKFNFCILFVWPIDQFKDNELIHATFFITKYLYIQKIKHYTTCNFINIIDSKKVIQDPKLIYLHKSDGWC